MGPKFGAQKGNKLGSQLGPMSITKLSPNWACQMGPIHCINFLLSGYSWPLHIHYTRTHTAGHRQLASRQIAICKHDSPKVDILVIFIVVISSLFTKFFVKPDITIL